ncbi:hypothetical protein GQ457_13G003930 [Hibiscus cannabinus]
MTFSMDHACVRLENKSKNIKKISTGQQERQAFRVATPRKQWPYMAILTVHDRQRTLVLLFITIVLMLVMVQPEARSYDHGKPTVAEKIDSMTMLEKLGYDLSKIEYYRRMLSGSPERISPGGPDPEHHV